MCSEIKLKLEKHLEQKKTIRHVVSGNGDRIKYFLNKIDRIHNISIIFDIDFERRKKKAVVTNIPCGFAYDTTEDIDQKEKMEIIGRIHIECSNLYYDSGYDSLLRICTINCLLDTDALIKIDEMYDDKQEYQKIVNAINLMNAINKIKKLKYNKHAGKDDHLYILYYNPKKEVLPTTDLFFVDDKHIEYEKNEDCSICYEKTTFKTFCNHPVCIICLGKLTDNRATTTAKCPLCRQPADYIYPVCGDE